MNDRRVLCPRCKLDVTRLVPPGSTFVACTRCGYSKRDMPSAVEIIGEDTCPACDARLTATLDVEGPPRPPRAGDLSVCWQCAAVLCFGEGLRLRRLQPDELLALPGDCQRELREAQRQVRTRVQ